MHRLPASSVVKAFMEWLVEFLAEAISLLYCSHLLTLCEQQLHAQADYL